MILGKKVVVVMPAYNAERTIEKTWREVMAQEVVDQVIVVDDGSQDATIALARNLDKVLVHVHPKNRGYGGNQKTCYRLALENGADIVVMVHPDYQYTPKLIPAMAGLVASGLYPCVLGSRILGGQSANLTFAAHAISGRFSESRTHKACGFDGRVRKTAAVKTYLLFF